jgi:hypothetical protein
MKIFDFIQVTISLNLKDPHSKALEPDCSSPFACNYDTVCKEGEGRFARRTASSTSWMMVSSLKLIKLFNFKDALGIPQSAFRVRKKIDRGQNESEDYKGYARN